MTETLVVGGTGWMGSGVVRRLLARPGARVAVLTRRPGTDRARRLEEQGGGRLRLVPGDLDDADALARACTGVDRVFANTDFFATGTVDGEVRQGLAVLEAARAGGVDRVIWSSLDSVVGLTGGNLAVPHYDAKAAVAAHVHARRSQELLEEAGEAWYTDHVAILTTGPYFENLAGHWLPRPGPLPDGRHGLLFSIPLGEARYPFVAIDDIAWFADHMFEHWQAWGSRDLDVLGDALTGDEIARAVEAATGIPCAYESMGLDEFRDSLPAFGRDLANMFAFFQLRDHLDRDRDLARLRRIHAGLTTFAGWARTTGAFGPAVA